MRRSSSIRGKRSINPERPARDAIDAQRGSFHTAVGLQVPQASDRPNTLDATVLWCGGSAFTPRDRTLKPPRSHAFLILGSRRGRAERAQTGWTAAPIS